MFIIILKTKDVNYSKMKYINNRTKMKYKCVCGNESFIRFDDFKNAGNRCKKCAGLELFTYEYVYNYFKNEGCELLENEYTNSQSNMKFKCKCGNESFIRFYDFKNRKSRCMKCSGKEKHTFENVYNYFKNHDCELLETEYINNTIKMKYRCKCGNISDITYNSFKDSGSNCMNCGYEKQKLSYLFKNYKMPSGSNVRIQGYENIALDELIKL